MLFPVLIFGQINAPEMFNIHAGTPYRVIDTKSKYYFNLGENILMVKMQKKYIYVQKYNIKTGKEIFRKELPLLAENNVHESLRSFKNHIYLFYSRWDKKEKIEQLFYKEINIESGEFENEKCILKINEKIVSGFYFHSSLDKTKLIIRYRKKPKYRSDKINFDEIGICVYNENLEEQWVNEIKMPYTESKMNNIDYQVDGNGNVYLLAEVYDTDISKRFIKGEKNYHLEVLSFSNDGMSIIDLSDEDYYFNDVWLYESTQGQIFLSGLYTENNSKFNIDGVFYIKIGIDSELEDGRYYKIPLEIINQFKSEKEQKKNEKKENPQMNDLDLQKIIVTKDGGALIIAEEYYVVTKTSSNSEGVTKTSYTYYYNDILVTKIDKSGEMIWMKKLPKGQIGSRNKGSMSFAYKEHNGWHYFFYVDDIKNINLDLNQNKAPRDYRDGSGGILSAYSINDTDGAVIKSSLADFRHLKINENDKPLKFRRFSTNLILSTKTGIIFEIYKKRKEDVMIHIDIED